jgi:1,2-diacylglycerol 3-alpha-glucosyltransferase
MRIGIVTYWFNRGQAVVSRRIREALDARGIETFILARPTRKSFSRPFFVDDRDVWAQDGVTPASHYRIPEAEYLAWAQATGIEAALFDQNLQFPEIDALRRSGVRTIGRFVWESFGPDDVKGARAAYDTIYAVTRCEQVRYRDFGIEAPRVRWGCPPELVSMAESRPVRSEDEVRFFFPGGYLSDRKPVEETLDAFRRVPDRRARLVIKVQHPVKGPALVERAASIDPRIEVVVDDLPDEDHFRLMASCDVCLAPTRWEGLGLHHFEALALGMPTITNDFPPMNEMVTHEADGLLVPAQWSSERRPGVPRLETDPAALAAAIDSLCEDDRRSRLEEGVRLRREALSWSNTEDDLLALVQGRIGVGVDR